jgi:hypothetical protein
VSVGVEICRPGVVFMGGSGDGIRGWDQVMGSREEWMRVGYSAAAGAWWGV